MGTFRKPRCQTGRLNAAERRDARERRLKGDVEKAMDGFFNNVLPVARTFPVLPAKNFSGDEQIDRLASHHPEPRYQ